MQLTALDYIEIEQLNRNYAWALDDAGRCESQVGSNGLG
jgi:hypothetical protein